jgi:hypothetical protein
MRSKLPLTPPNGRTCQPPKVEGQVKASTQAEDRSGGILRFPMTLIPRILTACKRKPPFRTLSADR